MQKRKKQNNGKCHNQKTVLDGIQFDSLLERDRYVALKKRQDDGNILDLQVHYPLTLIPKSKWGREIKYIADFRYYDIRLSRYVTEDTKSDYTSKLPVYRLKKRLYAERYNDQIVEIFKEDINK